MFLLAKWKKYIFPFNQLGLASKISVIMCLLSVALMLQYLWKQLHSLNLPERDYASLGVTGQMTRENMSIVPARPRLACRPVRQVPEEGDILTSLTSYVTAPTPVVSNSTALNVRDMVPQGRDLLDIYIIHLQDNALDAIIARHPHFVMLCNVKCSISVSLTTCHNTIVNRYDFVY